MRPFFPFYGSKWNIARYYPAPTETTIVEPFAGAAGYSTFYGAREVDLYDADPIIAGIWRYLLAVTPDEIMALPEMPNVGDNVDDFGIPQEAKWLIGFWLNRGSAQPKKSRTAYSARTDRGQLNWGASAKLRIAQQLELIAGWTITEDDFENSGSNDYFTWFIDPPYVHKGKFYRQKFSDHDRLGRWAQQRNGQVIVCEGPGADWLDFQPLGDFKSSTGRALERVWINE